MNDNNILIQVEATRNISPEMINEIHNSNRIIKMDGKIREVIDYLKMYENDETISPEVIKKVIEKLDEI